MGINMYMLEQTALATGLCIRAYGKDGKKEKFRFGLKAEHDPFIRYPSLNKQLLAICSDPNTIIVQPDTPEIAYALFTAKELVFIVGPANIGSLTPRQIEEYAMKYNIRSDKFNIPELNKTALEASLLLFKTFADGSITALIEWNAVSSNTVDYEELKMNFTQHMQDFTEHGVNRLGYAEEQDLLGAVRKGEPEFLENKKISRFLDEIGRFSDNAFKQREYTACLLITLASRAAILGGLQQQIALSIQDVGMQRLAKCTSISEIDVLCNQTLVGIASVVQNHQTERSKISYIEKARQYVSAHLSTPFTLVDVADEIGINHQYLSRRFKEVEGIGFKQYVQTQRLRAAANMLRFTDTPISTVAGYFCYPSQSHFCKVFKEEFGTTPQKFRNE